jgi:WD40 repeat protein
MAASETVAQLVFTGLRADFPELRTEATPALDDRIQVASLPGYEVRERIGEGAFGVVWRAYQPSVGREVAVKAIRPELATRPSFVRRFEAEARTIARLAHPHIVPLIDFWRDTESAYLVLGLMAGGSLGKAMTSGEFDRIVARRILSQIGAALDHAHTLDMVHGDLKPSNVLLDGSGNAYLSDFGLAAKLLDPEVISSMSAEPAYRAPEEINSGPSPAGDLYSLGVLARKLLHGDPELEAVLARATAFRPADRYQSAAAFLGELDEALGEDFIEVERGVVSRNPFKGLRPFEEADAADFYGRNELVATLVAAVADHRFVTVVGPSGSGKSSAVQAGLLPALARGDIGWSDRWFRVVITPGVDPMAALVQGLETVSTEVVDVENLELNGLRGVVDGELVVLIDQFEELYTLADKSQQRQAFVDLIADATVDPANRVRVVAALRADFYDRPLEDPRLGALVRDGLVTVLPPGRDELEEMITAPAHAVGLRWEPGLPHRIADDVAGQTGGLPLLQYALTELVERRSCDLLTAGDYERIGGVSGALANRAEAVYAGLDPDQQLATRQVMLRLVNVDEDSDDTRRRVRRSELESLGIARLDLDAVLDRLTSQRLLLADRDPATRGPTVEVAHEALLREWPRLRAWIDDQREALILGRRFRTALAEWESNDRHPDYLLTGNRLAVFTGWAETTALIPEELDYYQASRDKDVEERSARRRRRRTLTGILAGAAIMATILGTVAVVQAERASEHAQVARARELAAAAVVALESDPRLAKLLAVAAAELAEPTGDGISVLHQAYASDRVMDSYAWPADRETAAFGADLHPEGRRLVASDDPEVPPFVPTPRYLEVFDFETESVLWSWETEDPTVGLARARYSTDGARVIAGTYWAPEEGTEGNDPPADLLGLHLWDADTGDLLRRIDLGRCGGWVESFSAQFVLVSTPDPVDCYPPLSLEVVDLESGERRQLSHDFQPPANLTEDGAFAAFTDLSEQNFRSVVVDIETGGRVFDENTGDATWLVNQDGSLIVAGHRPTQVWDVAEGLLVATFSGHQGEVLNWDFGSDGETVLSVGREGTLRLWNASRGAEIASYPAVGNGRVSTTVDGRVLVADWTSRRASLLDLTPGEVWGIDTCAGFTIAETLQAVEGTAVLSADCPSGEFPTFVIDTSERAVIAEYPGHAGQDVRVSPDGTRFVRQVLVAAPAGAEGLWVGPPVIADLRTGTPLVELDGVCAWQWFTAGPYDGCVEAPEKPFSMFTWRFEWSPDSSLVAAFNDHGGNIVVWDAETGELLSQLESCGGLYFMFSDDASQLWEDCAGDLVVVSTETWETIRTTELAIEENRFGFLGYNVDRTSLLLVGGALGQGTGSVHWIDAETFTTQYSINDAHEGSPKSWAMSPDLSRATTGASDGWVKVWDVEERRLEQAFRITTQVQGVAFIDDGHLAVAPETGGVYVYTLDPGELLDIVQTSLTRGFTPLECEQFNFGDDCPTLEELRGDGS